MISLIIDTSTQTNIIALAKGDAMTQKTIPVCRQQSRLIIPAIHEIINEKGCKLADISFIAVGIGPGLFTGTRMGVTIAKSLSYALGLPLISFCSLEIFLPIEASVSEKLYIISDAKAQGLYFMEAKYSKGCWKTSSPKFAKIQDFMASVDPSYACLSPEPDFLKSYGVKTATRASFQLSDVYQSLRRKFLQRQWDAPLDLNVLYLRNP